MDASSAVRRARQQSGLTLRELGRRAGTSHATLAAYESGRVVPSVATLDRILAAAGRDAEVSLTTRVGGVARGDELAEVLDLAAHFPARHRRRLTYPVFGQVSAS